MQTLYGFVHNNPTHQVDSVGLQPVNVVDVVSVPCCSCCCPEDISADIGNLELKTELFSVGPFVDGNYYKDIWQHPVKINIDLSYDNPGAQNSDCTFEYWEWVDEEGEGEFDQDWDDHADAYAAQWDARTKPCGSETVAIPDFPGVRARWSPNASGPWNSRDVTKVLKIKVIVKKGPGCDCGLGWWHDKKTLCLKQTIELFHAAPKFPPTEMKEVSCWGFGGP
jgi:hypothetical protein